MSVRVSVSSSSLYLSVDVFVCEGMCVHLRPSVGLLLCLFMGSVNTMHMGMGKQES